VCGSCGLVYTDVFCYNLGAVSRIAGILLDSMLYVLFLLGNGNLTISISNLWHFYSI
jgi:hypothetical protein